MKHYKVQVLDAAEDDMDAIYKWIAAHDAPSKALYVVTRIEETIRSLSHSALTGTHPKELLDIGSTELRQIFFKPCRIIYQVDAPDVFVFMVIDGRRDFAQLLLQRMSKG